VFFGRPPISSSTPAADWACRLRPAAGSLGGWDVSAVDALNIVPGVNGSTAAPLPLRSRGSRKEVTRLVDAAGASP
jgi:hypothetical protein